MLRRSLSRLSPLLSNGALRPLPPLSSLSLRPLRLSSSSQTLNPPTTPPPQEDDAINDLEGPAPRMTVSIDRSGLHNPPEHSHEASSDSELVKHLKSIIRFRGGPISVAEYMEEVLTNPHSGFYINRDVFGASGDFVTSPEVSQMFGEMVGVWTMCLWEQMGQPENVNLIELGPGRGTLMADLLRGSSKFVNFTKSLNIHLVECSPALQKVQYNTLKCAEDVLGEESSTKRPISGISGAPVHWHAALEQVPSGLPTIILAHEFYDALPIHQFQKTSRGWCEKMIDVSEDSSFQFVLSRHPSPSLLYLSKRCKWASAAEVEQFEHIEVCPKAMELTEQIAKRISLDGGGALIIDYGKNGIVSDSLQIIG
ncbi:protein arginine methyltransferase NDUFAF7, mitochondrial isoform X2 [Ananas comosus]|uniref:Protein arginine methyltransferase NDUFAF7 n=1 Tax=Ananas comosus TaxID=4615 RepID=A0A6P5GCL5_ANACO|nr:protein arginine methyltransferase NDUFAF7, mitochondrial isoform X2 [Ananas comosus]